MNIAVIGGGNIGTLLAGELSAGGNEVRIYTSKPALWSDEIQVLDEEESLLYCGKPNLCSDNMEAVLKDAELVFVAVPSFLFQETAVKMEPYITPGMIVCIVPGSGGAELYFNGCVQKGIILCGMQRVHALANLVEYGKCVKRNGKKKSLQIGMLANGYISGEELAERMQRLLDIPCTALPNYLCVTLVPSNPILHTSRLYRIFRDYQGKGYAEQKPMYDTWDDETSEILFQCDDELQEICGRLDKLDLTSVQSLKIYYENDTPPAFTAKIRSIRSFQGRFAPMVLEKDGWHPDFSSRLFVADFEYGLSLMAELGDIAEVETPAMDQLLGWYEKVTGKTIQRRMNGWKLEDIYNCYNGKG